jgi:Ca-activated chloride channel family protein
MTFMAPVFLLVLALLLPLAAWGLASRRRRQRIELAEFGDPVLLARSAPLPNLRVGRRRDALRLAALALGLVALARPQFGERPTSLPRTGRDVLVLLDLSRSMNVADVAPTRLAAAKRIITQITSASPGDRVGLVVFGGSAFLQLPFTLDHAALQVFLDAATSDDLGDPATDVAAALRTALTVFEHEGEPGPRAVLLVSDGESYGGDIAAADQVAAAGDGLRRAGIPVFAVGVGTPAGGPVPADSAAAPERWHRDYLGRVVVSRLGESNLQLAARQSGGAYARWDSPVQLRDLTAGLARIDTRVLSSAGTTQRADRFQWPLALAVLALITELMMRGRREGIVAVLVLLACAPACRPTALQARRGERLYEDGKYREAYGAFERALDSDSDATLSYNAGNALYRMHRYDDAAKRFREVVDQSEPLRARSWFNLGNAYVRAAEEQESAEQRQTLRRAVSAFEEALRLVPADTAAKWNLELALRRLGDEADGGGSPGRGNRADYGRGNMDDPGYEGNAQAAAGAMAGGGYGSAEGESAEELSESQARQLLEAVQREQLRSHEGRQGRWGAAVVKDW